MRTMDWNTDSRLAMTIVLMMLVMTVMMLVMVKVVMMMEMKTMVMSIKFGCTRNV